jgi:hypothetical protein
LQDELVAVEAYAITYVVYVILDGVYRMPDTPSAVSNRNPASAGVVGPPLSVGGVQTGADEDLQLFERT